MVLNLQDLSGDGQDTARLTSMRIEFMHDIIQHRRT